MLPICTRFVGYFLLFSSTAFAQTGNTVFGAGYSLPVPVNAAPGQILTLFVQGVGANLPQRVSATNLPLPTVLAGISVRLTQIFAPQSVAVPLLVVRPIFTCLEGLADGTCSHYTAVTVQIPYELAPNCQSSIQVCPSAISNAAQLTVSENGIPGGAIDLNPVADEVHLGNLCDVETSNSLTCPSTPLITHADGTLISMASPAEGGEEIVLWALGLGATTPSVATGEATPQPAPVAQGNFKLGLDFRPNAPPYRPVCSTPAACPDEQGLFSGLTPGYAGL